MNARSSRLIVGTRITTSFSVRSAWKVFAVVMARLGNTSAAPSVKTLEIDGQRGVPLVQVRPRRLYPSQGARDDDVSSVGPDSDEQLVPGLSQVDVAPGGERQRDRQPVATVRQRFNGLAPTRVVDLRRVLGPVQRPRHAPERLEPDDLVPEQRHLLDRQWLKALFDAPQVLGLGGLPRREV